MTEDRILYIPIQLNGNTKKGYDNAQNYSDLATYGLKDREIFVIKNGVLWVGVEEFDENNKGTGKIIPVVAQGRVVPNADLRNPCILDGLRFGKGLVVTKSELSGVTQSEGKVVFVDTGSTMG